MALNRGQIRTEVRYHIKRKVAGYADARIDNRINWAQERIADRYTYKEMITKSTLATVDGTKTYTSPTGMKILFRLSVGCGSSESNRFFGSSGFLFRKPGIT